MHYAEPVWPMCHRALGLRDHSYSARALLDASVNRALHRSEHATAITEFAHKLFIAAFASTCWLLTTSTSSNAVAI